MELSEYITAYQIDCMEHMRELPDNFYDWGITDPNYGIGASRPSKKPGKVTQRNGSVLQAPTNDYKHKDWDDIEPPAEYFHEIKRVSKRQIIWGANYYSTSLPGGRLVWDKINGGSDQYDCEIAYLSFTKRTEMVFYRWAGMMQGLRASSNFLEAYKQQGNKRYNEKRYHPTQKPVRLYQWILNKWVAPGECVFDSHAGSLSLAIACELHGCPFTGTEKDIDYYTDSLTRINGWFEKERRTLISR